MGDLNYRLDLPDGEVRHHIGRMEWEALLTADQVGGVGGWGGDWVFRGLGFRIVLNSKIEPQDPKQTESDSCDCSEFVGFFFPLLFFFMLLLLPPLCLLLFLFHLFFPLFFLLLFFSFSSSS